MFKITYSVKKENFKKNINFLIFFILVSFLFGNIFGLNSNFLLINYPGIFFFFPLIFELINLIIVFLIKQKFNKILYFVIISIRRGFFLGICIEAFKVGS